ncbi:ATP-binding cassette domain-containing protein [Dyella halodurans]|uniref:Peptidase domain-containing ABC transporter n=1 Tax=Dyella halodurans TaxID=1920171 RepID=A0ABV9C6W7_9GAMM|nr:ATP-binding cassette domain-containing protein [Dyella halodurans]
MRVIYQNEVAECGYACLAMVLTELGRATDVREISAFRPISSHGLSMTDLYDVALEFGLSVEAYRFERNDLAQIKPGSILHVGGAHFVVFEKLGRGYVQVIDPATGRRRVALDTLLATMSGYLLECAPTPQLQRIRARSRMPAALERVRAWNPQLRSSIAKVMFVALAAQFAILAMPYLGWLMLDEVVGTDNLSLIHTLVWTFAGIFAIGTFAQFAQDYLTELACQWVRVNATEGLLSHLLRNPLSYFEKRNAGDLFARIKAQDDISAHAVRVRISLGIDLAVGLLALALMMMQSPLLATLALLGILLPALVALALFARMRDTRLRVLEESTRCDETLLETIRAAALIKLSCGETRRTAAFMGKFKSYAAVALQESRLVAKRDVALQLISYGELLVMTWLAASLLLRGSLSVGVFYAFMIYRSLASARLARSVNAGFAHLMLDAPAARVDDIMSSEQERYTPMADRQKAVEVASFESIAMRHVSFRYGISDGMVLADASLEIRRGDKIVVTGPSGSGKSTLFKLLAAAEPLQDGELLLNGIRWPNLTVDEIRRHVVHLRQGDVILRGSIADNVSLFTADADDERIRRVLEQVGLWSDVMRMPMRTRTLISDTVANISAGQRQRLLLARALYQPKEVLLLDEPTANLDAGSVSGVAELLRQLDRTVVVITHDLSLAQAFERRYRLVDGALSPSSPVHAATPEVPVSETAV